MHCLTGCAIGEVLGLVLATWWGWSDAPSIALAVALAFFFGYSLTIWPLLRSGLPFRAAIGAALAADTVSIFVMELVDNAVILAVPGAMEAGLDDVSTEPFASVARSRGAVWTSERARALSSCEEARKTTPQEARSHERTLVTPQLNRGSSTQVEK